MKQTSRPVILHEGEGQATWFLGGLMIEKAGSDHGDGRVAFLDQLAPAGFAPPMHVHRREDEGFYILDGEVDFFCDGQQFHGKPGSWIFLPRDLPHAFKVGADRPARLLTFTFPAGFERFVKEFGAPAQQRSLPPPEPPDVPRIVAMAAKYGIEILGPPPD